MQVKVTEDGHLIIPAPIRRQLGIRPGTWLEVAVDHGVLQASVVIPEPAGRTTDTAKRFSRLANLKPHPEALDGSDEDLDQLEVWDKEDWSKEWNL